ncbi:MAG: aminotransferase class I/II-fold pyridoxal phosphate-dependent enzyme, partial [Lachnospiraceae bacterium]|nr:aminotransferase class I/II-fold pyridoxal phosphate-dependent enzyme [Lachnospiraceae bacterium]
IPVRIVPTDADFRIRREDYIGQQDAGGIIFPNPNAPTGIGEPLSFVEEIVKNNPDAVVIVDEAYIDFGGKSAVSLIDRYENLLVVQTGSKSRAMAGLRVGWAFGSRMLIDALKAVKFSFNSYTMNSPAIALGAAAIRDDAYCRGICARIIVTRERLAGELKELGFSFPESSANFLFAKHERMSGDEIFRALRDRKIYVRHWNAPRIADYLRITVGTDEEADALVAALKEITKK